MASYHAPADWEDWSNWLAAGLHGRCRWRLSVLMLGMLLAGGRRTVTSWLRAAGVGDDFQDFYYFLGSIGRDWYELGWRVFALVIERVLGDQSRVLLAIDDSPTKRYGPKIEGAGFHHDPTPGPTSHRFCYGHVWVTLAVLARHRQWGTIGLPIWSWLYIRRDDVKKLPRRCCWRFQTKLEQAADLVVPAAAVLKAAGKRVWVVADGAYTKRPFVKPVLTAGVTLVGRPPKNAALRDLPPREKPRGCGTRGRGRKRLYGLHPISLVKRAAQPRGWQAVTCRLYGNEVVQQVKTFLATHPTFGGAVRVVIVRKQEGPEFFYCTDTAASVAEILETYADRAVIEQVFHDVKEVWGSGRQQVRNLWSNIGAWHLNLWLHTLVELWAWDRPADELVHRSDSPWDDARRRPSHADRRNSLQATCLAEQFSRTAATAKLPRKIRTLLQRLLRIAI